MAMSTQNLLKITTDIDRLLSEQNYGCRHSERCTEAGDKGESRRCFVKSIPATRAQATQPRCLVSHILRHVSGQQEPARVPSISEAEKNMELTLAYLVVLQPSSKSVRMSWFGVTAANTVIRRHEQHSRKLPIAECVVQLTCPISPELKRVVQFSPQICYATIRISSKVVWLPSCTFCR
jgi:hypothetical protein